MGTMNELKAYLVDNHVFSRIDSAFGEMVARRSGLEAGDVRDGLEILAAASLNAVRGSHSCLDVVGWCNELVARLENQIATVKEEQKEALSLLKVTVRASLDAWLSIIETLPETVLPKGDVTDSPLVRVEAAGRTLVFLNRFRRYEESIYGHVTAYRNAGSDGLEPISADEVHGASTYFTEAFEKDYQQQAAERALRSRFSIITGGPGTGKTTVLSVILALELKRNRELNIALCAPTGKAAARMKEAVNKAVTEGLSDQVKQDGIDDVLLNLKPMTVHSLLGMNEESDYPKRNPANTLAMDLVVVDECSMMSLQMFSQLLSALKPETRLILLGDKDQLASVDSGNVLAELCSRLESDDECRNLVSRLVVNHRSKSNEALVAFSGAIVSDGGKAPDVDGLYGAQNRKFQAFEPDEGDAAERIAQLERQVKELLGEDRVKNWCKVAKAEEAMTYANGFKALCAVCEGAYGVVKLNEIVRNLLNLKKPYANGLPIMVTRNDPVTGLSNGDIGVCMGGKVHFELAGVWKSFVPAQLPSHECALAMTIHKSQGSDYANVLMVLPEKDNPVLTRELVYTGITRTKERCVIVSKREILETALARKTERWSGLGELF